MLAAAGIGRWSRDLSLGPIVCDAICRVQCGLPADGPVSTAQLQERIHPEDLERVWDAARRALEEQAPFELRFRIRPNEEAPFRWLHVTGSVFHDAAGRARHFEGISQDITAERQLEESLRQTLIEKNDSLQNLELINSTGQALGAELQLEKLVQGVTDAATQLTRAAFGAFFYNVLDERGNAYMLYTLSGVPREAFAKFPMPRSTRVFEPTFKGEGILRSDDITKDPRYGHNTPRHGMPEGHLPVRNYLAVPVASRSGEVIGGLFFGHPTTGIFTAHEERLVAGRIGRIEGLLRVGAGAEVPKRDADGCRRAVRLAGGEAVQPSLGTPPLRPRSPQGRGRGLGHVGHCGLALNTTHSGVAPVLGTVSQAAWAVPGAPGWHAPHWEPSDTPAPGACLHTCRRRTRPARNSCAATRPNPAAACAPGSAPVSSLLKAARLPLPASPLPPLEGTPCW
ncbi:GAF domain-containing protein [Corallococcus carmarthensis]|uniref:GAF domain-containing protein n=1 Tax=Corallococcus carmarthensis TaxID=2316728 RepID=UPI0034CD2638